MSALRTYRDLIARPPLPSDLRTDKRAGERVLTRNDRPAWVVGEAA